MSRNISLKGTPQKHYKSVDSKLSPNPNNISLVPRLNQSQTKQLINRLSQPSQDEDYAKLLQRQSAQLRRISQRLEATVQLLRLMSSSEMSIRCLQHNNVLTLYCVPQHKLLCVNCTYTQSRHRTHKVLPIKDSLELISKDISLFQKKLQEDMIELQKSTRNAHSNMDTLNQYMEVILKQMQDQFRLERVELENKHHKAMNRVQQQFSRLIDSSGNLRDGMRLIRGKMQESLSQAGLAKYSSSEGSKNPLVKHLCASIFSSLGMFKVNPINNRQLNRLTHFSRL